MQAKIIVGTLRRDYGSLADWSSARRRQCPMRTAMVRRPSTRSATSTQQVSRTTSGSRIEVGDMAVCVCAKLASVTSRLLGCLTEKFSAINPPQSTNMADFPPPHAARTCIATPKMAQRHTPHLLQSVALCEFRRLEKFSTHS